MDIVINQKQKDMDDEKFKWLYVQIAEAVEAAAEIKREFPVGTRGSMTAYELWSDLVKASQHLMALRSQTLNH